MRSAVVTGGAGFIGSHLCERLVGAGIDVICVDSLLTGRMENLSNLEGNPRFKMIRANIVDGIRIDGPVDAILHLACPASPVDYARLPLETLSVGTFGTFHALELAREKRARFLLASTSEVYGDPLVHPQREDYWGNVNPVGPRSVYDEAKRASEAFAVAFRRAYGMEVGIVRIFNTYGPRMRESDGRAVPAFLSQALRGHPITVFGDGSQTRSLCYVSDLVDALLLFLGSDHTGPMNLGNPHEITMLELAQTVRRLTGSDSPIEFGPLPTDDPTRRCPDVTLARSAIGWSPQTDLQSGLVRTISWWRENVR